MTIHFRQLQQKGIKTKDQQPTRYLSKLIYYYSHLFGNANVKFWNVTQMSFVLYLSTLHSREYQIFPNWSRDHILFAQISVIQ